MSYLGMTMYMLDTDIDECEERLSGCHYSQICTNTWGSYVCSCSQGFRSAGPGQPCLGMGFTDSFTFLEL